MRKAPHLAPGIGGMGQIHSEKLSHQTHARNAPRADPSRESRARKRQRVAWFTLLSALGPASRQNAASLPCNPSKHTLSGLVFADEGTEAILAA
jgi:hypothetical protein